MKPINFAFLTRTNLHDSNPGDIILADGIRFLLESAFGNVNLIDVNMFNNIPDDFKEFIASYCDAIIIAGRPRLNAYCDEYQAYGFWKDIEYFKFKGLKIWDLWGGSGFPEPDYSLEEYLSISTDILQDIVCYEKELSDLIICRDPVMYRYLINHGVSTSKTFLYPCSSYWAKYYYRLQNDQKDIDFALVIRRLPTNEWILDEISKLKEKPSIIISHSREDYDWVQGKFQVTVINNPATLMKFYSRCKKVLSFRLHGAIPSFSYGALVSHIGLDSRRYTFNMFGDKNAYSFIDLKELNINDLEYIQCTDFDENKWLSEIVQTLRSFL